MKSRSTIVKAIGNAIKASIGTDVSNRIYFTQEAPQDKDLPLVIYFGTGDVPKYDMNKESLDADYQVSIFGEKDKGALVLTEIADTLIDDLSREEIPGTGYVNTDVQITEAGRIAVEGDYLHLILEFRILGFPSL